ncbi:MAG: hypothetical protein WBV70_00465 [Candidatus Bathyarchaeia archaeon]
MVLKAVFFDLHDTLVYLDNPLSSEEVSEFLLPRAMKSIRNLGMLPLILLEWWIIQNMNTKTDKPSLSKF